MAGENSQPPMTWRYCGNQIKLWRQRAGVSREALAQEASYDVEYVKSMELGRRRPTRRLLEVADAMCGAQGLLVSAQDYLQPERVLVYVEDYVRYEAEAIAISSYQPQLIPGLLQTEEYFRRLCEGHLPPMDDEKIEALHKGRLTRQVLLDNQNKEFSFIVGESPVRHPIGSREEHKRQLLHLLEMSQRRNVAIQVLHFGGAHVGLNGPFILLETPEHQLLAYEEGQMTGTLYADPEKVSALARCNVAISRRALSCEESAHFIRKLMEEL